MKQSKRFDNSEILMISILGKEKEEAKDLANGAGYMLFISREDSNLFFKTADYDPLRVNVEIDNKKVTKVGLG